MPEKAQEKQSAKEFYFFRKCVKCLQTKAENEFYKRSPTVCKACYVARQLDRYAAKRAELLKYQTGRYWRMKDATPPGQTELPIAMPPPQRGGAS